MTNNTPNAANILSTLSPEAKAVLESHYRTEVAKEIAGGVAPAAKTAKPAKARAVAKTATKTAKTKAQGTGRGRRQVTNDGSDMSASEFIRSLPFEMKAKEVKERGQKVGLDLSHALVHNVRKREQDKGNKGPKHARKARPTSKKSANADGKKQEQATHATTEDGRSAAQFVRDTDAKREQAGKEQLSAADMVALAAKAGLEMKPHSVHNARAKARKEEE